jgi:hypothetical protein
MRPTTWLRAASILALIHAILHTVGGVFGDPPAGSGEIAYAAMKANTFPVMGHLRSYWEFYRGMGLGVSTFLTIESLVFWLMGNTIRESDADLRHILVAFLLGYLALAFNSYRYFFAPPVFVELAIAGCLAMAIFSIKRSRSAPHETPSSYH